MNKRILIFLGCTIGSCCYAMDQADSISALQKFSQNCIVPYITYSCLVPQFSHIILSDKTHQWLASREGFATPRAILARNVAHAIDVINSTTEELAQFKLAPEPAQKLWQEVQKLAGIIPADRKPLYLMDTTLEEHFDGLAILNKTAIQEKLLSQLGVARTMLLHEAGHHALGHTSQEFDRLINSFFNAQFMPDWALMFGLCVISGDATPLSRDTNSLDIFHISPKIVFNASLGMPVMAPRFSMTPAEIKKELEDLGTIDSAMRLFAYANIIMNNFPDNEIVHWKKQIEHDADEFMLKKIDCEQCLSEYIEYASKMSDMRTMEGYIAVPELKKHLSELTGKRCSYHQEHSEVK